MPLLLTGGERGGSQAEELGSIAVDAKVVFTDESAKLEEMVQAAEEAIQRREAAAQAVAALQVELTAANETLKARLAEEGAARAKVDAGEEGATDGAAAAVRECRDCIIELDSKLALKQNEQLSILRELESVQEQARPLCALDASLPLPGLADGTPLTAALASRSAETRGSIVICSREQPTSIWTGSDTYKHTESHRVLTPPAIIRLVCGIITTVAGWERGKGGGCGGKGPAV